MARFMDDNATLPPTVASDDIYWPGSKYFLQSGGYYERYQARIEVPGFPYDPDRDLEYNPEIYIPLNGRPYCNNWWTDPEDGLRQALIEQIEPAAFDQFRTVLPTIVGGITAQDAEDLAIKTLFKREKTNLTGLSNLEAYAPGGFQGVYNRLAGQAGSWLEAISFYPKMYMVKVAAPIIQSMVLMMFYMLLPFALVFCKRPTQPSIDHC